MTGGFRSFRCVAGQCVGRRDPIQQLYQPRHSFTLGWLRRRCAQRNTNVVDLPRATRVKLQFRFNVSRFANNGACRSQHFARNRVDLRGF
jgi:hypothetical protein